MEIDEHLKKQMRRAIAFRIAAGLVFIVPALLIVIFSSATLTFPDVLGLVAMAMGGSGFLAWGSSALVYLQKDPERAMKILHISR